MSHYYSDPTANAAIGAVDKEIHRMRRKAARIRALRQRGQLSLEEEAAVRRQFVGIYRRLLDEALDCDPG